MPVIEAAVVIKRPPETVAAALLDPETALHWTTDLERFEVISRQPGEVGSVARLHYRQGDQAYMMEDVLEAMIPGQYFKSRVSGQGMTAQVETWLEKVESGTAMRLRWAGTSSNLLIKLMMNLNRGAILRQTRNELEKFRELVEARGARFSDPA
jgi:hypothetical protein